LVDLAASSPAGTFDFACTRRSFCCKISPLVVGRIFAGATGSGLGGLALVSRLVVFVIWLLWFCQFGLINNA
jgi:hypothetical protein